MKTEPRTVFVSGAGTGIGRATALAFGGLGDRLVLSGRRNEMLERTRNEAEDLGAIEVLVAPGDLSNSSDVSDVLEQIRAFGGTLDVLALCAGGNAALLASSGTGPERTSLIWTENFRQNVLTVVLPIESLRTHLCPARSSIVLVSSIAAYRGSGSGSYGASKAALHPYAYDLARELGPTGTTVNIVAPGYIAETEFFRDQLPTERRDALVAETSTRRAGLPEDVADTIVWLASASATHITGQVIQVNGGAELGR